MSEPDQTALEAAVFRRLRDHLRDRTDVQNIDMMNLAGFCRNCLSNWYMDAAKEKGIELDKMQAREIIYGMDYEKWRKKYQKEAPSEKLATYETVKPSGH